MDIKSQSIVVVLAVLIAVASTLVVPDVADGGKKVPNAQDLLRVVPVFGDQEQEMSTTGNKVGADLCPLCIQFTDQAINQLLNIILNAGVVGTCGTLCGALAQKTGSQLIGAACNILCDIEGVQEFIKIVDKADLDPIYMCELLKTCPIFDGGDAFITKIIVTPQTGPQGEKDITINYMSKNGTGTGQLIVSIRTLDGIPVDQSQSISGCMEVDEDRKKHTIARRSIDGESGFLQEPQQAGNYTKSLKLKAQPDPNCDPTQQPCEMWEPGNYTLAVEICNGECGSKHPHSKIYDHKESLFVIT